MARSISRTKVIMAPNAICIVFRVAEEVSECRRRTVRHQNQIQRWRLLRLAKHFEVYPINLHATGNDGMLCAKPITKSATPVLQTILLSIQIIQGEASPPHMKPSTPLPFAAREWYSTKVWNRSHANIQTTSTRKNRANMPHHNGSKVETREYSMPAERCAHVRRYSMSETKV